MNGDDGDQVIMLGEAVIAQINARGVAAVRTITGHAFVFTREYLEAALKNVDEDGHVVVHVTRDEA